ncbi:MAG: hypothetical protein V4604_10110 [Bacteroidota bacterium]
MKIVFSIFVCCLSASLLRGQISDSLKGKKDRAFTEIGGLTAYYFWGENSAGVIDSGKIVQPYSQNFNIYICPDRALASKLNPTELKTLVNRLAHHPKWDPNNHCGWYRARHRKERLVISRLMRDKALVSGSVLFRSVNGSWKSELQQSVLYFTVDANQATRFSHSSDSLIAADLNLACVSNGHYKVVSYLNTSGTCDSTKVFAYDGQDLTEQVRSRVANEPVRLLLLISGYRGPKTNNDPGDGLLTQKDRYYYWYRIDNRFQEMLKPAMTYYVDGSFPIATSNHRNRLRFVISWVRTKLTPKKQTAKRVYKRLTEKPNPEGFEERKQIGKLAGEVFLQSRAQFPFSPGVKDTLDIVSHSMGYAYSLGFLEVVEPYVVLSNTYIIAPENANQEGYDWSKFEHVWQYGSNLGEPNQDPLREQDGIAPQYAVKGIDQLPPDKGGRLFLPSDWPHKNFVDSHMIYSFDWIFDRIGKGQPGYVGNY